MKRFIASIFVLIFLAPLNAFALVPNDIFYFDQWYLNKIGAEEAWDISTGSSAVVVAILDSGVDIDHPDLELNVWNNVDEIPGNGLDDDGNGYIDDINGWNYIDDDGLVGPDVSASASVDAISHGSLIAGIVGAVGNNFKGVSGVNWDVEVMPLRVLDELGAGDSFDVAFAVDYAVANGADVINFSFSGDTADSFLREAIRKAYEAGVVVVSAIGNEGININSSPVYPACYSTEAADWVIGVASTDEFDGRSDFTNFGSNCVDISAPGEDIFGLSYHDPVGGFPTAYDGGWSGTSMSAPLVAGSAALLLSEYPSLSPEDIKTIMQLSVDPIDEPLGIKRHLGPGRLNIGKAMEIAVNFLDEVEPPVEVPQDPPPPATVLTNFISGQSFDTVYYIENDERRAFINAITYFTHNDSFSNVSEVVDLSLGDYRLSGLVLPKAGTVLVKIQSDPRVYALQENPADPFSPFLRAIDTEQIAITMYGENWSDFVIDIEPTFFTKFTLGSPIMSPEIVDTSIMKTRQQLAALVAGG